MNKKYLGFVIVVIFALLLGYKWTDYKVSTSEKAIDNQEVINKSDSKIEMPTEPSMLKEPALTPEAVKEDALKTTTRENTINKPVPPDNINAENSVKPSEPEKTAIKKPATVAEQYDQALKEGKSMWLMFESET